MTDTVAGSEWSPARVELPDAVVADTARLSHHTGCPVWCVAGAAMAVALMPDEPLGVTIDTGDGNPHRHVFDVGTPVSFRGLLARRSAPSPEPSRWVVLRAGFGAGGVELASAAPADAAALACVPAVLADAVRRPDQPVSRLSLVPDDHYVRLLERWAHAARPVALGRTVLELYAVRAAATPWSVSVVDERAHSYAEVDAYANRLARLLRRLGVGSGSLVGLQLGRTARTVAAILAVWRTGAAYVPLDPVYPAERTRLISRDAELALILTEPGHDAGTADAGPPVLLLGAEVAGLVEAQDPAPLEELPAPGDLAYVIYTSGSTGVPKGVPVQHDSLVNLLLGANDRFGVDSADGLLAVTSLTFDVAVFELFGPLVAGGRVILAGEEQQRDGALLGRLLRASGATVVTATPTTWHLLLAERSELPPITAVCTGEALRPALAESLLRSVGRLWNAYGPTEITVWATAAAIGPHDVDAPPVGTPLANTAAYVVDEHLRAVPPGWIGELCIAGPGVARGYLHRDELTAERFVDNPFPGGGRLYRTGDLAYLDERGVVHLKGRRDDQVKVAGRRVELGEVDVALARLPGVRQAATIVSRRDGEPDELEAFVVADAGTVGGELRRALGEILPGSLVPVRIEVLDRLPVLPSGKIDRSALAAGTHRPTPARDRANPVPAPPVVPETPVAAPPAAPEMPAAASPVALEGVVARLWSEILHVETVRPDSDFFDLGGTSLRAGRLVNELERRSGGTEVVYVRAVFEAPVLSDFCRYLTTEYPGLVRALLPPAGPAPVVVQPEPGRAPRPDRRITADMIRRFRRTVAGSGGVYGGPRLRRAAFLLSAPRSGSTLLRVMLAGHPNLFVPPELELLGFDRMRDRAGSFTGGDSIADEGLRRAIGELWRGGAEQARAIIDGHETVADMYRALQDRIGGRLLVDKTSTYATDPATLARAERMFEEPVYIHLIRHPAGMVHSHLDVRLDQIFRPRHDFTPRELAELIWFTANDNLNRFLAGIPDERKVLVRYEDLVAEPESALRRICDRLGVDYDDAMADPYRPGRQRMVTGPHPESRMAGDVKFNRYERVEPEAARAWRGRFDPGSLSSLTDALARQYGYHPEPGGRGRRSALSIYQRNVYLHERLSGEATLYNTCKAWELDGDLDLPALRAALQYVVDRHESLRTAVVGTDDGPVQHVLGARAVDLRVVDRPDDEVRGAVANFAATRLDLAAGDAFRVLVVRRPDGTGVIALLAHHTVLDGSSMALVLGDLTAAYEAALAGGRPELPPAVQPLDLGPTHFGAADAGIESRDLAFWRDALAGVPPLLPLPTARPRPSRKRFRGARAPIAIDGADWPAVLKFARDASVTPFILFLAAFTAVLRRYVEAEDVPGICVGTALANRRGFEELDVVGMFTSNLPLYTPLDDDPTFEELLDRVRGVCLDAFDHHRASFDGLVRELGVDRDPSYAPLVQVIFGTEPLEAHRLPLAGVRTRRFDVPWRTARFDLSVGLVVAPDGLTGTIEYDSELFPADQVERMGRHFETLLRAAVRAPGTRLSRLDMLDAAEVAQIRAVSAGEPVRDGGPSIEAAIREHARSRPDALALSSAGAQVSYGELERASDTLAARLLSLGVGPDQVVAVLAGREPYFVVACLGILKSGAAYLPIDPATPAARVEFLLRDSAARAVVTGPGHDIAVDLPHLALPGPDEPAAGPPERARDIRPGDVAYVIYTSGTTGQPKGVRVEHGNLANLLRWAGGVLRLGVDDPAAAVGSLNFDPHVLEIWPALVAGGTLHLAPDAVTRDPGALWRWLAEVRARALVLVTPVYDALLSEPVPPGIALRTVIVGGDRLSARPELARAPFTVVNAYGPTENTVVSTAAVVDPADDRPPAIGRPLPGTTAGVFDRARQPVPFGVTGELHLGGRQLARDYLNRPELTAERFPTVLGERRYRTGDLARQRADGTIEFVGRTDDQIKLRGYRIELGEVEAALRALPGVRDAAVVLAGEGDHRWLAGFYVGEPAEDPAAALPRILPRYLVPASFQRRDALPVTAVGKIDRLTLAAQAESAPVSAAQVEPDTALEKQLQALWRLALSRDAMGVTDSFFELGGDSLVAMRLVSLIRRETGHEVDVQTLFDTPTIRGLAAALEPAFASATPHLVRLSGGGGDDPVVCLHAADGEVTPYAALAGVCRPGRPVWALRSGSNDRPESVEAAAHAYADELELELPGRRLTLLGWSYGGLLAFEVARQLAARGRPPAQVLLVDSAPLTAPEAPDAAAVQEFVQMLRWPDGPDDWPSLLAAAGEQGWGEGEVRDRFDTFAHHFRLARRYRPAPTDQPLHVYVVADRPADVRAAQVAGWRRIGTGGITVTELPGGHFDAVRPDQLRIVMEVADGDR
jgi:amino acid adenylation domain-containing protein